MRRKQNGVTMVALIVTVVVLIILAGITIASIVGEEGVITKTKQAKKDTVIAKEKEQIDMALSALTINNDDKMITAGELQNEIQKTGDKVIVMGEGVYTVTYLDTKNEYNVSVKGTIQENVEKELDKKEEEANYWKTDGAGTLLYYALPDNVPVPDEIIVPNKIGDEVIHTIGTVAFAGLKFKRNPNGSVDMTADPPYELDSMGNPVFERYYNAKKLIISKGITTIADNGINYNMIGEIILPNTITSIGNSAFFQCTAIKNIVIPNGVTSIGNETFYECGNLENISLPSTLQAIGQRVFVMCGNLKSVVIPNGVTTIGEDVFAQTGLVTITFPNTVTTLARSVFSQCTQLKTIYFRKGVNPIPSGSPWGAPGKVTVIQLDA